ncbi:MAG: four helix bundle protein [Saprospiraceae bacterium]
MENNYKSFEDLIIWQESLKLSIDIYEALNSFKDYGLRDQIQRSSVSVSSNIAEGFERETDKEFIRFLYISKGSCAELRTQLYILKAQKNYSAELCTKFIDRAKKISAMIQNLITYKKNNLPKKKNEINFRLTD